MKNTPERQYVLTISSNVCLVMDAFMLSVSLTPIDMSWIIPNVCSAKKVMMNQIKLKYDFVFVSHPGTNSFPRLIPLLAQKHI